MLCPLNRSVMNSSHTGRGRSRSSPWSRSPCPRPLVSRIQPGVAVVLHTDGVDRRDDGQQQADAKTDRGGHDDQADDGLAAAADRQPQPESDHDAAPGKRRDRTVADDDPGSWVTRTTVMPC
jgi:hypothetical protein